MKRKDKPTYSFMWECENNLDKDTCELMVEMFDEDPDRYEGIIGNGEVDKTIKDSADTLIQGDHWEGYYELLSEALHPAVAATGYLNGVGDIIDSGMQMQRTYDDAQICYDWHVDTQTSFGPDGRLWERILTFIWYLNDDFEGGETEFSDCMVEPKQGKLLLFAPSSTMMHRGNLPRNGTKYICTGWLWTPLPIYEEEQSDT